MTLYMVFEKQGDGTWIESSLPFEARSARAAVSHHLGKDTDAGGGTFVAVPARSWRPVSVKVETKTALRFS